MKKYVFVLVMVLSISTSVNAAYLSIGFADTSGNTRLTWPGEVIDINVYVTMGAYSSDVISGVAFSNTAVTGLSQVGIGSEPVLPLWIAGGVNGPFGSNQFAVGASNAVTDSVTAAPGTRILIGVQKVEVDFWAAGEYELEITFGTHAPTNIGSDTGLLTYNQAYGDYAGYWAFGTGDPGKSDGPAPTHRPADPLIVYMPEPASLALLAIGGLALIRRR